MRRYVIGADVGSSALKAALVHPDQGVVAVAEHSYAVHRLPSAPGRWSLRPERPDVVSERLDLGLLIAGQREQDDVPGAGLGESL